MATLAHTPTGGSTLTPASQPASQPASTAPTLMTSPIMAFTTLRMLSRLMQLLATDSGGAPPENEPSCAALGVASPAPPALPLLPSVDSVPASADASWSALKGGCPGVPAPPAADVAASGGRATKEPALGVAGWALGVAAPPRTVTSSETSSL